MIGNSKNRIKLAEALIVSLQGLNYAIRSTSRGVYINRNKGRDVEICLNNDRQNPTLIEYDVSWYTQNLQGNVKQVTDEIVKILACGHQDELRAVHNMIEQLEELAKVDAVDVNKQIQQLASKIESNLSILSNTEAGYKAADLRPRFDYIMSLLA